jgi:hypothetical protein
MRVPLLFRAPCLLVLLLLFLPLLPAAPKGLLPCLLRVLLVALLGPAIAAQALMTKQ